MSDWKESVLSEFAKITMGQSPKGEYCNGEGEGLPLLNGPTEFGPDHPYPTQFTTDPKRIAKKGDILFCVRGSTTGRMNWANQEYAIGRGIASISSKSGKHNSYVYHLLNYRLPYLLGIATGSTFPNVSKNHLHELPINIPDNQNLEVIECILKYIDQKITLLREQNQTLEELTQTLFKRWFVEFNFPDKDGKPYKDTGGKMIDSELGEIPEGWRILPLSSIANYLNGLACQKYPVVNENEKLPVLKIKELGNGISNNSDWATSKVDPKYIIRNGDVIFSWSGTLLIKIWDGEECILNQHLFKVTSKDFPKWFIYHWTEFHLRHFIAVAQSKATTMGHIKRMHLDEALCFTPSDSVLDIATNVFKPLLKSYINNNKEIQTLTQLRDTLLPKLMSGELRIKN